MHADSLKVEPFFDPGTFTLTYVVFDTSSHDAVVIDPVLDYDPIACATSAHSNEKVALYLEENKLRLRYVLETHPHADHLSGAQWLKRHCGGLVGIGHRIVDVQATFKALLDLPESFRTDGSQFDLLLRDGAVLEVGALRVQVQATPGHTPACCSYLVGDAVFTGDALFLDDVGTGRCDFPRGSAEDLYTSVHDVLYALPPATRVFPGHDYPPPGRSVGWETTIGRAREMNVHLRADTTREQYVKLRKGRDATLTAPRLLFPSIQVNVDAGRLPPPHANGRRYLVIPINAGRPTSDDGTPIPT